MRRCTKIDKYEVWFLDEKGFHLWAGEARQGTVGVRGRPEDLLEPGV